MKKLLITALCISISAVCVCTAWLRQSKNVKNTTHNNISSVGSSGMQQAAGAVRHSFSDGGRNKTSSGLEYEITQEGTGASPKPGSMVTVHYTGWLNKNGQPSGQPFDSSHNRRQPFTFQIGVGMVIQGWDEGVMTMKVGEKRRLYIPSQLGYGSRGAGAVIPANANLIFDVELMSIT